MSRSESRDTWIGLGELRLRSAGNAGGEITSPDPLKRAKTGDQNRIMTRSHQSLHCIRPIPFVSRMRRTPSNPDSLVASSLQYVGILCGASKSWCCITHHLSDCERNDFVNNQQSSKSTTQDLASDRVHVHYQDLNSNLTNCPPSSSLRT